MRVLNRCVAIGVLLAMAAACTSKPIVNFEDQVLPMGHTPEEVKTAIIGACAGRGWAVQEAGPGQLRATLNIRTHVAISMIDYSASSFSIRYVDSTNLDFKDGKIHGNYNRWVNNLRSDIQAALATVPPAS